MPNDIGIALTGLGSTLRDVAQQETLARQQERQGQLALAEVGLKSQLLGQQGQVELAKTGVALEEARSRSTLGQFEAGLKSAAEGRAAELHPLTMRSTTADITKKEFDVKRGEQLLPGEVGLQHANIGSLGAQTAESRFRVQRGQTLLPGEVQGQAAVNAYHGALATEAQQRTKALEYANEMIPMSTVIKETLAPLAAGNPILSQLGLDAVNDWSQKTGINLDTETIRRGDSQKYADLIKAAYPYLEKFTYSGTADAFLKQYQATGDKAYLAKAQEALTRAHLNADPKVREKILDDSIKTGQSIPDLTHQLLYGLNPVDTYYQNLMAKPENAKAYAGMNETQKKTFDAQLRQQATTMQAQEAARIDASLPTPATPPPPPAAAPPTPAAPAASPPPASPPPVLGSPAALAPPADRVTRLPGGRSVVTPAVTEIRNLPGGRQIAVPSYGTPQVSGGAPPPAQAPVQTSPGVYSTPGTSPPGLAQAATPAPASATPQALTAVPPSVATAVQALDSTKQGGTPSSTPTGPMPDGKYTVPLPNGRLYLVEVQGGKITYMFQSR